MCDAVKDFFVSVKLLKSVNATFVSLVPKVACPRIVGDYRPIACCNILYKAITKIITSRLQCAMGNLVNEVQGAFIQDKSIADNVLICQGLVRGCHKDSGAPRCLMKLDLRKAYDTLNWNFIEAVLTGLKFPRQFIQCMMVCISTPKFSLMINGSPC